MKKRYIVEDWGDERQLGEGAKFYREQGFVIFEKLIAPQEISQVLNIVNRLALSLCPSSVEESGDDPFLWLVRNARRDAGSLFDTLVKIPEISRILYSRTLQNLAELLLDTEMVLASPSQMNLRADHPGEQKFLYPWHNDYAYNCSSRNSLVYWIPLQDVDDINGCLHIVPGSHRFPAEIHVNTHTIAGNNSAEYFSISNMGEILQRHPEMRAPMEAGSALAFSALLLHKSGVNRSDHTRFAFQSRWFDGLAHDALSRRWRGGIDEGNRPVDYLTPAPASQGQD